MNDPKDKLQKEELANEHDTQERSDAIAAEESHSDEADLMPNEPADEFVEGQPKDNQKED